MPQDNQKPGVPQPEYVKRVAYRIFALGHGYRVCADILELSVYTVREWYAQYKLGQFELKDGFSIKKPLYDEEFKKKVVKFYFDTKPSMNELANHHKVSERTVRRWIKSYQDEVLKKSVTTK